MNRLRRTFEERFWSKVDKSGPVPSHVPHLGACWVWTAGKYPDGYGNIRHSRGKNASAHRVSRVLSFGELPLSDHGDDLCVLHRCDNRACVRPDHLFIGTKKDNAIDRETKRRHGDIKGEKHPCARLTEADVRVIRGCSPSETHASLGRRFGISYQSIRAVRLGMTWRHVS